MLPPVSAGMSLSALPGRATSRASTGRVARPPGRSGIGLRLLPPGPAPGGRGNIHVAREEEQRQFVALQPPRGRGKGLARNHSVQDGQVVSQDRHLLAAHEPGQAQTGLLDGLLRLCRLIRQEAGSGSRPPAGRAPRAGEPREGCRLLPPPPDGPGKNVSSNPFPLCVSPFLSRPIIIVKAGDNKRYAGPFVRI